jgi:hypothetical protein
MTKQEQFLAKAGVAANIILTAGAVASALVFVNSYYRYHWTGERELSTWRGALVYYVGPTLLAGLLFAALWLKREYRINLAIVCVALTISIYGGELILGLIEPPLYSGGFAFMDALRRSDDKHRLATTLAKEFGVEIDLRDSREVAADLRAKGIDALRILPPGFQARFEKQTDRAAANATTSSIFPLGGGVSNTLTVLCNETGQFVSYNSDERGFRNTKGLWQSGHIDIVTIGDSFTLGECAPAGKYFVDLVRLQYPATLNLGMSGNGPLMELATLKEYVPPLRPKLVLWFYFEGNDLLDLRDERRSPLLMRYLEDRFSQELSHRQREVDRVFPALHKKWEAYEREVRESRLRNKSGVTGRVINFLKLPRLRARLGLLLGRSDRERQLASELNDLRLFRQCLSHAKTIVDSWGGALDFVYLPGAARFMPEYAFDKRLGDSQHDKILKVMTELGIPVIDLLPAFEAQRDPRSLFPFGRPGHYAETGHRLVADEVLKAIGRNGIFRRPGVIADASSPGSRSLTSTREAARGLPPTRSKFGSK